MIKLKPQILILLLILLLSGCTSSEKEIMETNPFSGLWKLYIMEQKDSESGEWNEWRNGMQGYILYHDDMTMAVHLTTKGYQDTELSFPNFNDTISVEALKYLTNSYTYFANYKWDKSESWVEHSRISHSNPGEWNDVVKRRYTFVGDTLILQPIEAANSTLRLKWVKAK